MIKIGRTKTLILISALAVIFSALYWANTRESSWNNKKEVIKTDDEDW